MEIPPLSFMFVLPRGGSFVEQPLRAPALLSPGYQPGRTPQTVASRRVTGPLLLVDAPYLLYRAFYGLPDKIKGAEGSRSTRCSDR